MARVALMAIRPEFTKHIFSGDKRYELRTRLLAPDIDRVIVYETAPTSKVVGWFYVGSVVRAEPATLWPLIKHAVPGTDEESFNRYFAGRKMAYAITIQGPERLDEPVDVARINGHGKAPQSWTFHDDKVMEELW